MMQPASHSHRSAAVLVMAPCESVLSSSVQTAMPCASNDFHSRPAVSLANAPSRVPVVVVMDPAEVPSAVPFRPFAWFPSFFPIPNPLDPFIPSHRREHFISAQSNRARRSAFEDIVRDALPGRTRTKTKNQDRPRQTTTDHTEASQHPPASPITPPRPPQTQQDKHEKETNLVLHRPVAPDGGHILRHLGSLFISPSLCPSFLLRLPPFFSLFSSVCRYVNLFVRWSFLFSRPSDVRLSSSP